MITIERKVHFGHGRRARKELRDGEAKAAMAGRVPRVSRIMALAIRFDGLIRDGVVKDQAELARLGHVSRARLTQIMDLLCLAPDIQEAVLFLPNVEGGHQTPNEKVLRSVATVPSWRKQRQAWQLSRSKAGAT
ncbi:MAG: hypothetical protein WD875_14390 [Pirellulales bacterium]